MRGPVRLQQVRRDQTARVARGDVTSANSLDAVCWEIGLVVAAYLGVAVAAGAILAAVGVN